MRKLWKPGRCPIPGFLFFVPSDLLHASRRRVRFFCSRRIAPLPELCPSLAGKTGGAGALFCFRRIGPLPELRPLLAGKTGGAGAVFCFRRIAPLPELRPSLAGKQGVREPFFVSGELVPCRSIGLPMAGVRGCDGIARIAPNGLLSGLNRFVKRCPTAWKPVVGRGYVMKLLNIFKIFLKYLHNSKHPRIFAVKF